MPFKRFVWFVLGLFLLGIIVAVVVAYFDETANVLDKQPVPMEAFEGAEEMIDEDQQQIEEGQGPNNRDVPNADEPEFLPDEERSREN